MPKIDSLKEELAVLREEYKNLFLYLLATLSGTVTSFYQVLIQKVGIDILFVSIIGFIISIVLFFMIKKIRVKINKSIKQLEMET